MLRFRHGRIQQSAPAQSESNQRMTDRDKKTVAMTVFLSLRAFAPYTICRIINEGAAFGILCSKKVAQDLSRYSPNFYQD